MDRGFISLSRKIRESGIWRMKDHQFKVWVSLLLSARWEEEPSRVPVGGEWIEVRRGQVWTTQRRLAEEARVTRKQLRGTLQQLERKGSIRARSLGQLGTLITVVNYDSYQRSYTERAQAEGPPRAQEGPTKGPIRTKEQGNKGTRGNTDSPPGGPAGLFGGDPEPVAVEVVDPVEVSFGRVLERYPRHLEESRRTKPGVALKTYRSRKLYRHEDRIIGWIEFYTTQPDWQRGAVPGLQVFLKWPDIVAEDPPEPSSAIPRHVAHQPGIETWLRSQGGSE